MVRVPKTSLTAAGRGEAELRILNFKTTWSEFQKPSQTTAKHCVTKLHILDFKTTWSEFQKPSQTTSVFHPVTSGGPKQLCASAHLGCTREAGTS